MAQTKYLIIGSSHAGLSALDAIRVADEDGSITIVSRENTLPYSPTILPYVVSGDVTPEKINLRNSEYFDNLNVTWKKDDAAVSVDTDKKV